MSAKGSGEPVTAACGTTFKHYTRKTMTTPLTGGEAAFDSKSKYQEAHRLCLRLQCYRGMEAVEQWLIQMMVVTGKAWEVHHHRILTRFAILRASASVARAPEHIAIDR